MGKQIPSGCPAKKALKSARLRKAAERAKECYRIGDRRACTLLQVARSTLSCESTKNEQASLRIRLKELAAARVRYGYRRLHILRQHEGWQAKAKRAYRLYCERNLNLHTKLPKRHASRRKRSERSEATRNNGCWVMDFMSDELFDGRKIRLSTIVDHITLRVLR